MKIKMMVFFSVIVGAQSVVADGTWAYQVDAIMQGMAGLVNQFKQDADVYAAKKADITRLRSDMNSSEQGRSATLSCAQDRFVALQNQFNLCCSDTNQAVAAKTAEVINLKTETLALRNSTEAHIAALDAQIATLSATLTQLNTDYCTLVGAERTVANDFIARMTELNNQCEATRQQKESFLVVVDHLLTDINGLNIQTESDLNAVKNSVMAAAEPTCYVATQAQNLVDYIPMINDYAEDVSSRVDILEPVYTCENN